jgi:hypothetical protein
VIRRFRHWTPQYVVARLRVLVYQWRFPEAPWLTQAAIEFLSSWLRPGYHGLEWGSGRSTLWFARRVACLVSVEHDENYYREVSTRLKKSGLSNVDYRHCSDESGYLAVGENLPPLSLDFVLVDGIARDRCALAAVPRLKPGGLLILDNSNWYLPSQSRSPNSRSLADGPASETWDLFTGRVQPWRCLWTTNGVWDTTLWAKPDASEQ